MDNLLLTFHYTVCSNVCLCLRVILEDKTKYCSLKMMLVGFKVGILYIRNFGGFLK